MKRNMSLLSKCGDDPTMIVYQIRNKIDGKMYIGQTVNCIRARYGNGCKSGNWWKYISAPYLKNAIQKYGHDNFELTILEQNIESIKKLDELERFYIKKNNTLYPNGYNYVAGGQDFRHDWFTKEQRDKISLTKTNGRIVKLLNNITGEIHEVSNINRFRKENNLDGPQLYRVVNKELMYCKEWSLAETPIRRIILTSPDGQDYVVFDGQLSEFCRRHGLSISLLNHVANKKQHHHKGWTTKGFDRPYGIPRVINSI